MAGQITMNEQKIINATITIEEVVDKGKKLSIKANDGSRTYTYSVWKTKQDGTDSATYAQFKTMGLTVGLTVMIGYVIDEYDTEIGGVPKRIQSKKIINFREAMGQPVQTPSSVQSPRTSQFQASGGKSEAFWDMKAFKQCLWNYWLKGSRDKILTGVEMDLVWNVFNEIEGYAETRFSGSSAMPNGSPDLPIIQQEELDADLIRDIPF